MGNCTASRLSTGAGDDENAVALCRDRKRLLKSAVERRYALADAHRSYVLSLRSVAAAVNIFVARHSAPTPILITLPQENIQPSPTPTPPSIASPPPPAPSPPSPLRHRLTPTEPKTEPAVAAVQMASSAYFFPPMHAPSPPRDFGWDFFNPFDGVRAAEEAAMLSGLCRSSDEDLRAVREQEGIPDLEDEEDEEEEETELEAKVHGGVVSAETEEEKGERGLTVTDTPGKERELLDALRDVEDQFIRAFDSGKDLCRMLEVDRVHLHSGIDEIKGCFFAQN